MRKKNTIRIPRKTDRDAILYVRVKPANIAKLRKKALDKNMSLSLFVDTILDASL
jgi:hypothetical protein